jgi:O-antigen/teichoic acid export membrane protein
MATAAGALLSAAAKALLAQVMTINAFGSFSFGVSFLQLSSMLFEFGLFMPIARLAVRAGSTEQRSLVGAALLVYLPIGLAFGVATFGLSFVVDGIFSVHTGDALRVAAPLAFGYPFVVILLFMSQGVDRLHLYSLSQPLGNLAFVAFLIGCWVIGLRLSESSALVASSAGLAVGLIPMVMLLRPVLSRVREHTRTFVSHARSYGFQLYVGRVLALGTYQMDVLMLGAMTSARTVALYVLAGAIANVIGVPSTGIGSALFKRLSYRDTIDGRWLVVSSGFGVCGVLLVWLLTGPFLRALFPTSYAAASVYVVPLAIAAAMRGTTALYNNFLSAYGRGKDLARTAYILTGANLVLNLLLIPPFGGTGAAWASAGALAANLGAHQWFYRRWTDTAARAALVRTRTGAV